MPALYEATECVSGTSDFSCGTGGNALVDPDVVPLRVVAVFECRDALHRPPVRVRAAS